MIYQKCNYIITNRIILKEDNAMRYTVALLPELEFPPADPVKFLSKKKKRKKKRISIKFIKLIFTFKYVYFFRLLK